MDKGDLPLTAIWVPSDQRKKAKQAIKALADAMEHGGDQLRTLPVVNSHRARRNRAVFASGDRGIFELNLKNGRMTEVYDA